MTENYMRSGPKKSNEPVTDRLRKDILRRLFTPGERLVELQLAAHYEVGRAAIRASIMELVKEGLVVHETNRGAAVRTISTEAAIEINDARELVEGLIARYAARKANDEERIELKNLIESIRVASKREGPEYAYLVVKLYGLITQVSRYMVGQYICESLLNIIITDDTRIALMWGLERQNLYLHEEMVEAIINGDEVGAEAAMRRAITQSTELMRKSIA